MADCLAVFDAAPKRNTHGLKYCRYLLLRKYDGTAKLANFLPSKMRALHFSNSGELHIPRGAFSFAKRLRTLDFSECSGILLPSSVGQLKQLRCLIAPRMQNESLPECITELSKLQYLNINGSSKITELPESIGKLGSLEYLRLSGCSGISKLPESFGEFKCMVHLNMSGCSRIRELPDSLGNLTHLKHLELSRCSSIKAVPQSLCGLTQLQYLNLSSCACLEGLPAGVGSLIGIQHLNMSGCVQIRELPESLMKLQSSSHLNLSGCRRMWRGSLAFLRGLTALQHLDISYLWCTNHKDLSDDLRNLTNNLKYLSLRAKQLRCCDFIATLTNLEHLDLSCNFELANLPESIGNLKRLHTLDLSRCIQLTFLPESIGTLGLKSLVLDGCSDALLDQASSLVNYSQTLPMFKVSADEVNGCSNLHLIQGIHVSELRIRSLENVMSLEEATKAKLSDRYNLSELTLAWSTMDWSTKRAVRILKDKDLLEQLVPLTGLKSLCLQGYSCTSFPGWLMDISRHLPNLVSIELLDLPMCSNLPPLGQLPHLEKLKLCMLPSIKKIDWEFCGGKGAFRQLSSFTMSRMEGLEEWNTTYSVEDGVEEFIMFPVLDSLTVHKCRRLRLKPCPPTFRECSIRWSDQVISSLEEVDKTSHHCSSSSPAIKLDLATWVDSCQRLFHHFPALRELTISGRQLMSVPESVRHLTSLESLMLDCCERISALPEWLGDLSSLRSLVISRCDGIKSLPACIQQLTKLQKLEIRYNQELKEWCESEENKATTLAHIKDQVSSLTNSSISNNFSLQVLHYASIYVLLCYFRVCVRYIR
jgi:Leucine-rich repeat (LRR) protein